MRACVKCGLVKAEDDFRLRKSEWTGLHYRGKDCKTCHRARVVVWRRANLDKVQIYGKRSRAKMDGVKRARRRELDKTYNYRKKYGITAEEKNRMLANQYNGGCMICNSQNSGHKKGWVVDHDHKTNKIRAILCHPCNMVIGFAREKPETLRMAAKYLEYHSHGY